LLENGLEHVIEPILFNHLVFCQLSPISIGSLSFQVPSQWSTFAMLSRVTSRYTRKPFGLVDTDGESSRIYLWQPYRRGAGYADHRLPSLEIYPTDIGVLSDILDFKKGGVKRVHSSTSMRLVVSCTKSNEQENI
jgi:hypothetical protein